MRRKIADEIKRKQVPELPNAFSGADINVGAAVVNGKLCYGGQLEDFKGILLDVSKLTILEENEKTTTHALGSLDRTWDVDLFGVIVGKIKRYIIYFAIGS